MSHRNSCVTVARNTLQTVRDIYEAIIIYSFLVLICEYGNGEAFIVSKMITKDPITFPFPLNFFMPYNCAVLLKLRRKIAP